MYPVSAEYKNAIAASAKDGQTITGTITLEDATEIPITPSDIVAGSLYLSEQCVTGEDIEIGNVFISELGFSIKTPSVNPYSLGGARVSLNYGIITGYDEVAEADIWEYVPLGLFYITEINRKTNYVEVVAMDGLVLMDIPLGNTTANGTAYDIINSCCTTSGVQFGMISTDLEVFPNYNLSVSLPDTSSVQTCRDLLMWACQLLGCFARMDRVGELELVRLNSASVKTITDGERYSPTKISDTLVKVTEVLMPVNDVEYSSGTAGMLMALDENPLLESASAGNIQGAVDAILAEITLAEYTPCEFDCPGDPALQSGDYITLADTGSLSASAPVCLITHSTWRFRGKHNIKSVGKSAPLRSAYSFSQMAKAISSITSTARTANSYAQAANLATVLLNSAIGGNVLMRTDGTNNEILIMDSTDPDTAVKMWRFNINGWGYSNNCVGADNPARTYTIMATMDGALTATKVFAAEGTFTDLVAGVDGAQRIHEGYDALGFPFFKMYSDENSLLLSIVNGELGFGSDVVVSRVTLGNLVMLGTFID